MKVNSNGVDLEVAVEGSGKPVLLVHGFPDTRRLWSRVTPALLDAGYQVITYDTRGYGGSDQPADVDAYNIINLAIDVTAVLDGIGVEQADLVGHDWGAATTWAAATFAPDRFHHHVALSVGHPLAFGEAGLAQREKSWYMLLFQFQPEAEQWLSMDDWANFRSWASHPDADAVIAELEASGSLTPALNYYRANVHPRSLVTPRMELPPCQVPTMGVWSSGDMALTEAQMTGSAAHCAKGFRYERLDGPGHWMQWEAPDAVSGLLIDFLGS